MAPRRANPTETEKRLDQLEADQQTLARLLVDTHGAKPVLLEILGRHKAALETRPQALAPEQRVKAVV